jgi:hypothetical protein
MSCCWHYRRRNRHSNNGNALWLHDPAEHGGPFIFIARRSIVKAALGEDEPPIGNPRGKKGLANCRETSNHTYGIASPIRLEKYRFDLGRKWN